jgi:hypothetical protein
MSKEVKKVVEEAKSYSNKNINLDSEIVKFLKDRWKRKHPKKFLSKYEDVSIRLDWTGVEIKNDPVVYTDRRKGLLQPTKTQTLFTTKFENQTELEQEYSFKSERSTKQVCSFVFDRGYTLSREANLKFSLPDDVLEVGTGVKPEYSIKCGYDETKEEEVKWGVDSRIKVGPESSTIASVNIKETMFDKEFKCRTTLSGEFTIYYTSKPGAKERVQQSEKCEIVRLIYVMKKYNMLPSDDPEFFKVEEMDTPMARVVCTVEGRCNFKLGVEQHVHLKETRLNENEESSNLNGQVNGSFKGDFNNNRV